MRFHSREEAAHLLAQRLGHYRGRRPLVLGIPRGAVPMARIIADAIDADLDVVLVRKLRAPHQPELAIGAVDESGRVSKGRYVHIASDAYRREEIRIQQEILRRRRRLYTGAQPPIDLAGRIAIIVDDGVATGSSMLSAIHSVKSRGAANVVAAIGVASAQALERLEAEADEVVCLDAPIDFYAVGQFFEDFSEVTDADVVAALDRRDVRMRDEDERATAMPEKVGVT
jgi:putative phosphoribosyl transferase